MDMGNMSKKQQLNRIQKRNNIQKYSVRQCKPHLSPFWFSGTANIFCFSCESLYLFVKTVKRTNKETYFMITFTPYNNQQNFVVTIKI